MARCAAAAPTGCSVPYIGRLPKIQFGPHASQVDVPGEIIIQRALRARLEVEHEGTILIARLPTANEQEVAHGGAQDPPEIRRNLGAPALVDRTDLAVVLARDHEDSSRREWLYESALRICGTGREQLPYVSILVEGLEPEVVIVALISNPDLLGREVPTSPRARILCQRRFKFISGGVVLEIALKKLSDQERGLRCEPGQDSVARELPGDGCGLGAIPEVEDLGGLVVRSVDRLVRGPGHPAAIGAHHGPRGHPAVEERVELVGSPRPDVHC